MSDQSGGFGQIFTAPTMWLPGKIYDFAKWKEPFDPWMTDDKPGMADMLLSVDASGHIKDVRVEKITPSDKQSYSNAVLLIFQQRMYLPAYRNGKPVDSTTHAKFYFVPAFYRLQ